MNVDAAVTVPVNVLPLVDDTDFKSIENTVAFNATGMDLQWNFVTTAGVETSVTVVPTSSGVHDWTNSGLAKGLYKIEIPSSGGTVDNDATGFGWFTGVADGVLPWTGPVIGFRVAAMNTAMVDGSFVDSNGRVDLGAIVGDTASPASLLLQYNGTGINGNTFPATQSQVSQIGSGGGSANNEFPILSPNGFVITNGANEVNNEDATRALLGDVHQIDDDAGGPAILDVYYLHEIGASFSPNTIVFTGRMNGNNDDVGVYVNTNTQASPTWVQRATLEGSNSSINQEHVWKLENSDQMVGADAGKVAVRFFASGLSSATLTVDQIVVEKTSIASLVGYSNGSIWVDTVGGTAGTVDFVNGVADKAVLTWADALTLSASLGIKRFEIANGSTIALSASSDNLSLTGEAWTLQLAGKSIANMHVRGAKVSGTSTGSGSDFHDCAMGTVTIGPCDIIDCRFTSKTSGGFTMQTAGDYTFHKCGSMVAGNDSPIFTFPGAGNTFISDRAGSGGRQYEGMSAGDLASIEGWGQFIEGTCSGGAVTIRGCMTKSGITNITLTDDARFDVDQINAECDTALSDYDGPTNTEMEAVHSTTDTLIGNLNDFDPGTDQVDSVNTVAAATLADGAHGGSSAVLTLKQLIISGANGAAGTVDIDNSSGPGIKVDGTTSGVTIIANNGSALLCTATGGNGHGISAVGEGSGDGMLLQADQSGGTGHGLEALGGNTSGEGIRAAATVGKGISALGSGANGHGIYGVGGNPSGAGMFLLGGEDFHGLYCYGGATSGNGIYAAGQTEGDGIYAAGAGTTEHGIYAVGSVTTGSGILIEGGSTSGSALKIIASAGPGVEIDGTTFGVDIASSAGPAMSLQGAVGLVIVGSGDGITIDANTVGVDIGSVGSANIGIRVAGTDDDILADITGTINGMTTAMKAEVEAEVNDALVALNLDHLMKTAVANRADMTAEVADDTVLANIMTKTDGDTSDFVPSTDSLEGLADGAAGGGATAAQVWEYSGGARALTDKDGFALAADGVDLIVIESGTNMRQALSLIGANCVGVISGAEGTTVICLGIGVATTRTTTTTTVDGNRTAVTLNKPA